MNPIPAQKDSSGTGCGGDLELIPGTAATGSVRRLQAMEQTTRYIRLPRVLIAGDDDDTRKLISVSLREAGYEITECRSAIGLMDYVGDWHAAEHIHDFSLVVSELPMPDMAVFELFEAMSPSRNLPPVILVVDVADTEPVPLPATWAYRT